MFTYVSRKFTIPIFSVEFILKKQGLKSSFGLQSASRALQLSAIRSLSLQQEPELRMLENRLLSRIFAPRRDELTGGCSKQHRSRLHNLYSSRIIIIIIIIIKDGPPLWSNGQSSWLQIQRLAFDSRRYQIF
jgi:hypothetical protein